MARFTGLILVAVLALAICTPALADDASTATAIGNIALGGMVSVTSVDSDGSSNRTNSWTMAPSMRYFVRNNFSLGAEVTFNSMSRGDFGNSIHRYMGLAQYVFQMDGNMRPWAQAGGGFSRQTDEDPAGNLEFNGWAATFGVGAYMFINEHVAITPQVSYIYETWGDSGTVTRGADQTIFIGLGINGFMLP